jgi:hypothetical protein
MGHRYRDKKVVGVFVRVQFGALYQINRLACFVNSNPASSFFGAKQYL